MATKDPEKKKANRVRDAARHRKRMEEDPEYHDHYNARKRKSARKRREDPDCAEQLRAYQKEWRRKRGEETPEMCTKSKLIENAHHRAKKTGVPFNLKVEDIDWPEVCPILGTFLDYSTPPGRRREGVAFENSPSIDQIIPGRGYVHGNVAVISNKANMIKNSGTAEEHRLVADWIEKQPCW